MKKFTSLLLLCFVTLLYGQTPCENGMAGVYPCNGYDLLSEMTVSEFDSPMPMIHGAGQIQIQVLNMH